MVQSDYKNWLRKVELLSLILSIIGWPLWLFIMVILIWYIILPVTPIPWAANLGIILFLMFGITYDTRFGLGGLFFVPALRQYLKHSETKKDRRYAYYALYSSLVLIVLYYGIWSIISSL